MSVRSVTNLRKKKRPANNPVIGKCISLYVLALEENSFSSIPRILLEGERFYPDMPCDENKTQISFLVSNETSPRGITFRLNILPDEYLLALQTVAQTYASLTELRFEFCALNYDQLLFIQLILQENPKIVYLSVNGNPKNQSDLDMHHLPLTETHLTMYSLQLCTIGPPTAQLLYDELISNDRYTCRLVSLNLGCNQLGDEGCAIIGYLLRANRTLQALNVADNSISEAGLLNLLSVFSQFDLSQDEIRQKRRHRFHSLMNTYFPKNKEQLHSSSLTLNMSQSTSESLYSFHPFSSGSTLSQSSTSCNGNHTLAHLNISYNDITVQVLEDLIEKIEYQKKKFKSGGLQRVLTQSPKQFSDLRFEISKLLGGAKRAPQLPQRSSKVRPESVA